jgi:hypothetical protein
LTFSIVSFLGIIVSSSSQVIFGQPLWSPIDLLDRFLDDDPSDATRFGVRSLSITNSSLPYAQLTVPNRCGSFRPPSSLRRCVKILRSVKTGSTGAPNGFYSSGRSPSVSKVIEALLTRRT